MNTQEATLINELFDRIAQSGSQQRDPEADQFIQQKIASMPHAPYVLAQSTIVLQQAVTAAQQKIAHLEQQLSGTGSAQGGGFLSGVANLFIPPMPAPARPIAPPPIPQQSTSVPQGGGFLQSAMATAAGVAGGALLFQGIESLLGHGGGLGNSGLMGGSQPPEVVNNYYMDQDNDPSQGSIGSDATDIADNEDFSGLEGGDFDGDIGGDIS